ncbi:protein translocase subunit SecDF [Coprobacter tertius]|uniref:Multifunctional fusion protein n=1 Tax=Coprobacter tertius TaxID=2944915 RepID=A0ABT1MIJ1_9BACT|nr:protein translocase subunit SecDF [Coprobacter tertius]MCP9612439.1 protein translocase subunit SecDF [Coprobacter tertius]
MQNKGFIRVFAVLLTLVCLFYLSFSLVTRHQTKKAEEYANGDSAKYAQFMDSISTEKVYLWYYTFKQCREMEIGLGLDLKGGMNVTLQISVADVLKSLSNNNPDVNFNKALAEATANQAENKDFLSAFYDAYKRLDPNVKLSAIFSTFQLKEKIKPNTPNDEVLKVLRSELNDAIDNSFNVLRTRIDRFGVVAPNIQRLEKDGRILVELPGVKEPERVRKLLQGSANLEFWETYNLNEFSNQLSAANEIIAKLESEKAGATTTVADSVATVAVADTAAAVPVSKKDSIAQKIKELKEAENEKQNIEAWKKQNPLFSKLQMNVSPDGRVSASPAVGIAHYSDTAAINRYLALPQVRELLPANLMFKWGVKAIDEKEQYYQLVALKSTNGGRPPLEGDVITDAREDFDRTTNSAIVSMSMNAEGSKIWEQLTRENIGKCIAIVLDNQVYSFPVVNTEISGGNSQISGNFTPEEAKDLANVLKSGKMAASVKIVQEDIIGPSLGQEAIQAGIISFIFALVLLMIYMISMYGVAPGLIANGGIICNLFFTMGVLASFQAVLTLSGIAGLVLSMGMAVDANVLIFERSKEELRLGKNLKTSISDGYKNAFSAIFDSNLTSVITGVILFMFGTGPIKGFATTLIIGILMSFFTAVFLTRLVFEKGLDKGWFKNLTFTTPLTKNFLAHPSVNFLGQRKTAYIVAIVLVVLGIVSFGFKGLNQGIEFTGGRNYIVRFDKPVSTVDIADKLKPSFEGSTLSVITIGGDNQVRISTNYKIADSSEGVDTEIESLIYNGLKDGNYIGDISQQQFKDQHVMSTQKVGPSIADDIKIGAFWAVIFSLIAIALYILLRFRDISFSVGTLTALAFDTVIIIGFYSIFYGILPFSMEIDQSFIAAILTVIGYSVNDKVVVFDRVREVAGIYPKRDKKIVINDALNSTLSRTINTSSSTFIVLLCIFILGGDTIRSFTFAMLLGVIIGTLSTLYMAVPVAYELQSRKQKKELAAEAAKAAK